LKIKEGRREEEKEEEKNFVVAVVLFVDFGSISFQN